MTGYTKLFGTIIASSIWSEDDQTRIVWITMLAAADKNGVVNASVPGLARLANVSLAATEIALQKFLGPDPHSRSKQHEGRRIEVVDGGWKLLNHADYRKKLNQEERQGYQRQWDRDNRGNRPNALQRHLFNQPPTNPTTPNKTPTRPTQAEAEAKADTEADADTQTKALADSRSRALRLNKLFRRRESTKWDEREIRQYRKTAELCPVDEFDLVEKFYATSGVSYLRTNLLTLLNNWNGEVDRARAWNAKGHNGGKPAQTILNVRSE